MPIKSFRGLLKQSQQDTINLHTNDGSVGYRIVKFELLPYSYGSGSGELESIVKIYKTFQTTVDSLIDFSDNTLLAAGIINNDDVAQTNPSVLITIFDNEIFNQDIYIYHKNENADEAPVSYYFELEQMDLALDESTVATLKDIRNAGHPA